MLEEAGAGSASPRLSVVRGLGAWPEAVVLSRGVPAEVKNYPELGWVAEPAQTLCMTPVKATSSATSVTVEGTAVKPHMTQPTWGKEDLSEGSERLSITLPREVVTSPLDDGKMLLETLPNIFMEFSFFVHNI